MCASQLSSRCKLGGQLYFSWYVEALLLHSTFRASGQNQGNSVSPICEVTTHLATRNSNRAWVQIDIEPTGIDQDTLFRVLPAVVKVLDLRSNHEGERPEASEFSSPEIFSIPLLIQRVSSAPHALLPIYTLSLIHI